MMQWRTRNALLILFLLLLQTHLSPPAMASLQAIANYQIACAMCSSCECNPVPSQPPPPPPSSGCPPPPSPPSFYYNSPPPPYQPTYYYSPPPPSGAATGGGGGSYYPPRYPAPPPPNPIVPYFPFYFHNPPPAFVSSALRSMNFKFCSPAFLFALSFLFF
ncbi:hypothetical protein Nepgr_031004 [Nepenthes gracilis]|uniref:Uncharacterized protein n=1 Tax=Nepenthes gracilis TaxID=150966 RepID=A0AAD3Y752_NEPGR|nr:hypothetical protein Nepgr_031004 [Nepenthes gracilis]